MLAPGYFNKERVLGLANAKYQHQPTYFMSCVPCLHAVAQISTRVAHKYIVFRDSLNAEN